MDILDDLPFFVFGKVRASFKPHAFTYDDRLFCGCSPPTIAQLLVAPRFLPDFGSDREKNTAEIADAVIVAGIVLVQADDSFDRFAPVRDFNIVRAVEAGEAKLPVGDGLEIRPPLAVDQIVERAVCGLFRAIASDESAVVYIFSAEGGVVRKVPPNDGAAMLLAEPELVQPLDDLGLRFLVLAECFAGPGGDGNLGEMDRQSEFSVAVQNVELAQGVQRALELVEHFDTLPMRPERVILHADALDGRALVQPFSQRHVVIAAVSAVMIAEAFLHALVPEKAGVREMTFAEIEAPFFVVALVRDLQIAAAVSGITVFIYGEHFVDYVNVGKLISVSLGDLAETPVDLDFDLAVVVGKPARLKGVVDQTMSLHIESVLLAEPDRLIQRRTAGDEGGILFKARLALLRLQRIPIQRDDGVIEDPFEFFLVRGV